MGIKKWLLTYGFGSPGHTARTITKGFHYYLASNASFDESIEKDGYFTIYYQRYSIQEKLRNRGSLFSQFSVKIYDIIDLEDMPLFVFAILSLESNQFRSGISNDNIDLVLEVIREEVAKMDDSLIKLDPFFYKSKAINFLNSVLFSVRDLH